MRMLNAITTGDRSANSSYGLSTYDIMSDYGASALSDLALDLRSKAECKDLCNSLVTLGLMNDDYVATKAFFNLGTFFNRMLGIPLERQARLNKLFDTLYQKRIQDAVTEGTLDTGIKGDELTAWLRFGNFLCLLP